MKERRMEVLLTTGELVTLIVSSFAFMGLLVLVAYLIHA